MVSDNNGISKCANFLRVPELIFVILISVTMLSINGKLFWLLNVICGLFKIFLGLAYIVAMQKESGTSMLLAMDIVVSFIFFFETVLQSFDTFYVESGFGKVMANIVGFGFIVAYGCLLVKSKSMNYVE